MKQLDRALPIALLHAREATLRPFRHALDEIGLTVQQWRVIRVLAEGEARNARELSELCVLQPPSLSRILKALVARGLIERVPDEDARVRRFVLAGQGYKAYEAMAGRAAGIYARLEEAYGSEKMELLLDLLSELRRAAEAAD